MKLLLCGQEPAQLINGVLKANLLPGDIAEVGVFEGGSAELILKTTSKTVHLFDTFEGLPESEGSFTKGDYNCSYDKVMESLAPYPNKLVYKGLFPSTAEKMNADKFCLVHIDCDLSKSITDSLEYFYPKMVKGGYIFIHDQANDKVAKAVIDFFAGKPEMGQLYNYGIICG